MNIFFRGVGQPPSRSAIGFAMALFNIGFGWWVMGQWT